MLELSVRAAWIAKRNQGLELSKLAYSLDFLLLFDQAKRRRQKSKRDFIERENL